MTIELFILLFAGLLALSLALCWLDHRHGWQWVDWLNGKVSSPFRKSDSPCNSQKKDQTIGQLEERIRVLERIVTEPAYELNRELERLKEKGR